MQIKEVIVRYPYLLWLAALAACIGCALFCELLAWLVRRLRRKE